MMPLRRWSLKTATPLFRVKFKNHPSCPLVLHIKENTVPWEIKESGCKRWAGIFSLMCRTRGGCLYFSQSNFRVASVHEKSVWVCMDGWAELAKGLWHGEMKKGKVSLGSMKCKKNNAWVPNYSKISSFLLVMH